MAGSAELECKAHAEETQAAPTRIKEWTGSLTKYARRHKASLLTAGDRCDLAAGSIPYAARKVVVRAKCVTVEALVGGKTSTSEAVNLTKSMDRMRSRSGRMKGSWPPT